jgi:hypothetical protein
VNRAADEARAIAREEIRQELEAERRLRIEPKAKAAAARAAPTDLGEIEMNFSRDSSGKISSPVRITTGGAGDYEMTFDRGKNGRISRATLKPRNG